MERGKKTEGVDGEIHWHEAIIQHIQSFLSCKEAAQTSILCKSWYNAWATRPIVYLDQRHFQSRGGVDPGPLIADRFLEYSKGTMRRYAESNLKIESFRLCMEDIYTGCFSLFHELIVGAIKLGACDLDVEIIDGFMAFYLPNEVLRSENLVRLSVSGCRIDLEATGGKVGFSKLKSLSLRGVVIVGFSILDIASNCHLKCLYLEMSQIDKLLFNDMTRSFPCLKDLTLVDCWGFEDLQIYSPSLEFLSIAHMTVKSVKFDLPSLRKFTYKGRIIPHLSFEAASREWESDITIVHKQNYIESSWLFMLLRFLMKLTLSKISLSLCLGMEAAEAFDLVESAPSLPKHEGDSLLLSIRAPTHVCSKFLKGVFCTCPSIHRTLGSLPEFSMGREENNDMLKLLYMILKKYECRLCCIPSRDEFDKYGVEKVDVEVFYDSLAQWRPLPLEALVDASESGVKKQETRFTMWWRQNPFTH